MTPKYRRGLLAALLAVLAPMLLAATAAAQCALAGNPDGIGTLADRRVIAGDSEVIVDLPPDGQGFAVGWAERGRTSATEAPGGKRVIGGRDTIRYTNKDVPQQQVLELHVVGAGISPMQTVIGPSRKPMVLVVVSNGERARWKFFVAPGTRLAKVVLQGMQAQVDGLPSDVEVVRREPCALHTTGRGVRREAPEIEYSPLRIRRAIADIRAFTGLVETSFQHGFAPTTLIATATPDAALPALHALHVDELARATDAKILDYMDGVRARLPEAMRPTVSLLMELIGKVRIPAATFTENGERLPLLWYPPETPETGSKLKCTSNVLVGQGPSRSVKCPGEPRIYFMEGTGRSSMRESAGNSLFVPGRGSASIEAGTGRDLIVLERGWGIVRIGKTCGVATSRLRGRRPPLGMRHTGFIVFGAGVRQEDLFWWPTSRRGIPRSDLDRRQSLVLQRILRPQLPTSGVLVNRATRDLLILKNTCFNFVFLEDGKYATPP